MARNFQSIASRITSVCFLSPRFRIVVATSKIVDSYLFIIYLLLITGQAEN